MGESRRTMDPNAALDLARDLASRITGDNLAADDLADLGEELAVAFQGLDGWLSRGGFKPVDWQ